MTRFEKIKAYLEELDQLELIELHNEYCRETSDWDRIINSMDELDEELSGESPYRIANMIFYGDFCPAHVYFWFDGYGNLASSDRPEDEIIFIGDMARYIDDSENGLNDPGLDEILMEDEEDE